LESQGSIAKRSGDASEAPGGYGELRFKFGHPR
jgi:hypothetical protein